jgi:hypothetical protein
LTIDFVSEPDRKFVTAECGDRSPEILRPNPQISILLPNDREYFSTTTLFWTTGSAPARWFEIGQVANRFRGRCSLGEGGDDSKTPHLNHAVHFTPHAIFYSFHRNPIDLSALTGGFCHRFRLR